MNAATRLAKAIWELFVPSDPEPTPQPFHELHERVLSADGDWRAWQIAFDWLNVNEPEAGDGPPYENYIRAWDMVRAVKGRERGME